MIKIHLAAGTQQVQMQRVQNAEGDPHLCITTFNDGKVGGFYSD